jgi:FAD/FMN-containing dehydrogenase
MEELTSLNVYPISIRSGGHGYANQGSCSGVMINLAALSDQRVENDVARHQKAVPHGDCFCVGAGGGWDANP